MLQIRQFENLLIELFSLGKVRGTTHTCIGQESSAVGVCAGLGHNSIIISNHRGHGHYLAHTGDFRGLLDEIVGLPTGICSGWGGSQHLCSPGKFYSNGILGGTAAQALGLSLAAKMTGEAEIAAVFLGDGALGQGIVYETLNLAVLMDAPLLFVVENNGIAQTTKTSETTSGHLKNRFEAFGIECIELDGQCVQKVYEKTLKLKNDVLSLSKPKAVIINSVRLGPHSKGDDTRSGEEMKRLKLRDPIKHLALRIEPEQKELIDAQVRLEMGELKRNILSKDLAGSDEISIFDMQLSAKDKERDELSFDEILADIKIGSLQNRINNCLGNFLSKSANSILMGEDIMDPYGGAFKITKGLSHKYNNQVWQMPICENGIVGMAGGMALGGVYPIVEIMFGDFLGVAGDQLLNYISKYREMYGFQNKMNMIIRTPMGGRRGYGPTHSQTLDKHFVGIPGLRVYAVSPFHSVSMLYEAAAQSDDPVLMIENKLDYTRTIKMNENGNVGDFNLKYSKSDDAFFMEASLTEHIDHNLTILTYGGMTQFVLDAAVELLIEYDVSVKVFSTSRLYPVPTLAITEIAQQGPILFVEEGGKSFGIMAEFSSTVSENVPECKTKRIAALDFNIPSSMPIENQVLPTTDHIISAAKFLIGHK